MLKKTFAPALKVFAFMTVLCGIVYTLVVTGVAQLAFPFQANGSMIDTGSGEYSELIGQSYSDPGHLWGRPVSYSTVDVNGETLAYAAPSNLSPASSEYADQTAERVDALKAANPDAVGEVPVDLVTESGSGLDPEISVYAARWQVPRIAKATGKTEAEVSQIIERCTNHKLLGIFGEETVNVMKVNLMLDGQLS